MTAIRAQFLLDPGMVFLNHGSFGATPRPVFEVYQQWQRRLEYQPVQFMGSELFGHLRDARQALADYVGGAADDLAFVPNTTFGVNVVARSLHLSGGDEVLTTDHEYGACDNVWKFVSQRSGASYVHQSIPFPAPSPREIVETFWEGVTSRTKVIFISHITSQTALCLPAEAVCRRAREAGILTIVDGAHAPGHIPLDMTSIGADFYIGNCHKWMCAPKGSAFLYTRSDQQALVEPLVVSWGWGNDAPFDTGSRYLDNLQWWGTADPSAFLAVPAAIRFQAEHDWPAVQQRCYALLRQAIQRISDLTGLATPDPGNRESDLQMAVAPLPAISDLKGLQERLYADYRVEVPLIEWQDHQFIRVCVQGYNTQADIDTLLAALAHLLPHFRTT